MDVEERLELMKVMFNPRNVAIMGATEEMMKIGSFVGGNILNCGFTKNIYPINPNPKYHNRKILGNTVYPSLDKCPEQIDIVGIVVPPEYVIDTIKQAIENDVRTAAIITAGFGEVKTEEAQRESKDLVKIAKKGGLIFIGPNSMGFYTSEDRTSPLHLGFGFMTPKPGDLSIVSQSGTMGITLCNALEGIRYFVSSGNEACLTLEDYLHYYAEDDGTKVIALFAEMLRDGRRFKEICTETTKKKPILFLKTGITETGARVANTHTGSIAGSLKMYKALFKQTGVILADQIMEFIYLIKGARYLLPLPNVDHLRAGIISSGGGFGVHLTDLCEKHGIKIPDLNKAPNGPELIKEISKYLPFYWSHNNPVDMVATGNREAFQKIMDLMLKCDFFDIIFTMTAAPMLERIEEMIPDNIFGERMREMLETGMDRFEALLDNEIKTALKHPEKKVIYVSLGPISGSQVFNRYDENKIMVFGGNLETPGIVLQKLYDYQKFIDCK